ncbi:MAG: Holliday junction branch migration protein RuvA [Saprospiraceae bacterium]|nr:Holliday junction branch migration protein RuvA [Bacteroidia bacterium]NNE14823.1 Holliday junction branch migration protein RuvA [Saprospiraceae bacterium]NNL90618.1 Holliday junction branch migration protein RuvA [Saprospiraceae bacterium]
MIAYVEGNISYKAPNHIFLDIGGLAYDVQISLNTYAEVESLEKVKLFTHLIVREDSHSLYGFYTMEEKDLFTKLISVSGIGPNTARVILSYMTPKEAKSAILTDNVAAFKKVKGVGPKTAQRLILDLKDKVAKDGIEVELPKSDLASSSIREEAISAMLALGFNKNAVSKQIEKALNENPSINQVENLIKAVLRQLS